jgi:hypothetical protein
MPDKDDFRKAFDFAADVRKFEISLFWQRSLFFWGFITTTTVAYGAAHQTSNRTLQFGAAMIGVVSAFLWTLVNRSSLYWQRHWELELAAVQIKAIDQEIYGDEANRQIRVQQGWFWKPLHYSLSKLLIAFSDFVVLIWLGLAFRSSPLWLLIREWVPISPYIPAIAITIFAVAFVVVVLWRAGPSHINETPVPGRANG